MFLSQVDYADLPIIDLAKTATPEDRLTLAQQARDAMSNHGFFYVINHGLTLAQVGRTCPFIKDKTMVFTF